MCHLFSPLSPPGACAPLGLRYIRAGLPIVTPDKRSTPKKINSAMAFTVADRHDYLLGRERLPRNEAAVFVETRLATQSPFVRNEGLDRIVNIEEDKKWAQIRFVPHRVPRSTGRHPDLRLAGADGLFCLESPVQNYGSKQTPKRHRSSTSWRGCKQRCRKNTGIAAKPFYLMFGTQHGTRCWSKSARPPSSGQSRGRHRTSPCVWRR